MKKPFVALLLACFVVCLAEGPWAFAQAPQPDTRPSLQAPPTSAQPAPTPAEGKAAPTPPATGPAAAPAPGQTPPGEGAAPSNRRRPDDLLRPALRRTSRTTRPAPARPVNQPGSPSSPTPSPAPAQVGSPATPGASAPGSSGSGTAASPSTPNVVMPTTNSEGVMELPGEKEFNQCKKVASGKRILKFSFKPETEITDLIGWISAISCTQFLIGGTPVAGKKVTVMSPQLITLEEAYRLFLGALESVNLTVEPMGKFLRIVDTSRARFSNLPFQKNGSVDPSQSDKRYVTRLFRFDHLDPNEVMNLYNQVRGEQGIAVPFQGSLIITDQAVMLDRFGEIVKELDQPSVIKEKIWMVRVRNTSATEMAGRLAEIFAVQQMGVGGRRPGAPGAPAPMPAPPPAPGAARGTQMVKRIDLASQLSITKLIPDERSNQLIVVANEQAYEWLLTIMKKLDVPIEGGGDGRFHIYYCEHANCDELAATLSAITGVSVVGGVGARRTGARTSVPGAPPPPIAAPSAPGQAGQQMSQLFEGDVRVTFDAPTNSLVVYASLKDFQSLRRVIEKLDGPRKQVYVEAMILEVLLDKKRTLGVAYHGGIPTSIGGKESVILGGFDAGKTLNPAALATDLVGLAGAVFGPALEATTSRLFGTQVDIPSFGAFLKLLQENNDVNVLSTPHLLITNNQEGEISVGQRLPFPGGFLGGLGGAGQQAGLGGVGGLLGGTSVSREDVSLRMKLIPSVNEYNMIRLDVDVEISDLLSENFGGLGPATSKRTAKTPVFCKDQQTVVIGGLMSDRQSDTVAKVPILGDIPVLGFFFRSTRKTIVKQNIIIALTPYVISDMEDLRRVAEKKMRERREFIERYSAVEDKAQFEGSIDYRRKRGMLEEINRAAREADDEEAALRVIRERELQDESTPIEPPGQTRPRANEAGPSSPATPPETRPGLSGNTRPEKGSSALGSEGNLGPAAPTTPPADRALGADDPTVPPTSPAEGSSTAQSKAVVLKPQQ